MRSSLLPLFGKSQPPGSSFSDVSVTKEPLIFLQIPAATREKNYKTFNEMSLLDSRQFL